MVTKTENRVSNHANSLVTTVNTRVLFSALFSNSHLATRNVILG